MSELHDKNNVVRLAVIMPVFNEGGALRRTLDDVLAQSTPQLKITIYLVDDGSRVPVRVSDVVLARHRINLGQGAALETARQMALRGQHDVFVTMDSDGQHQARDLPAFIQAVQAGADVVFGSRFMGVESVNMPGTRRIVLRLARAFEEALTGLALSDAHNGYRAFSRKGIEAMAIRQNRMAHATEIKQNVARDVTLVVKEIPVQVTYSEETLAKGQSSMGAVYILRDLLYGYLFGGR